MAVEKAYRGQGKPRGYCCCLSLRHFIGLTMFLALWLSYVVSQAKEYAVDHSYLPVPLRPYRPTVIITLNYILMSFPFSYILPSLKTDDIMYGAEFETGLKDWEDKDGTFIVGLQNLSHSLINEGDLTPIGIIWARIQLHLILTNRLKIIQYTKDHPQVLKEEIKDPVFIAGTPRGGTSFFFNLIKFDTERFRSPRLWELNDPIPPTDPDFPDEQAWRIYTAELGLEVFRALAPTVVGVYSILATNAEECMPILAFHARSLHFNTILKVPSYQKWLMEQKQFPALLFHKKYLQVLQSGGHTNSRKTWLLKAPWHMNHLDEIWQLHPTAKIIQPQRSPVGLVPSLGSLHCRFYGIVTDNIQPEEIGHFQHWQWAKILPRFLEARKKHPEKKGQIVDVYFKDLVNDPIEVVRQVYKHFGWELKEEVVNRMKSYLAGDEGDGSGNREKKKKHVYEIDWFGVSEEELAADSNIQQYCKEYGLEMSFKHSDEITKK